MKGTTYKRTLPSGHISWEFQVDAGRDENGKRLRIVHGGFRREKDAQAELTRLLTEKSEGLLVKPEPRTFAEFMEEWFREHAAQKCTPKTAERYSQLAAYVLPHLGAVQLRDVSTLMLERVYSHLRKCGGKVKGRGRNSAQAVRSSSEYRPVPLSVKTVRNIAGLVHVALSTAVRWKLLKVNPAEACELPPLERKEARALDPAQTEWYLDAARGHWLYPILVIAAATGCRRGEVLGLTWPDLNLDAAPGMVTISKSIEQTKAGLRIKPPKNGKTRALPLPTIAVDVLKAHRAQQDEYRRDFGPDYRTDLNLVFCTPEGEYLKPDSVTAKACLLARKCGLKGIGLHSLRHSHGSQLLAAGVPLPTVSKRLGHSNVAVTAAIYSHAFTRDELAAADAWDTTMRNVTEHHAAAKQ